MVVLSEDHVRLQLSVDGGDSSPDETHPGLNQTLDLSSIRKLNCIKSDLHDISLVSSMTSLRTLVLTSNEVSDLSPLSACKELRELLLRRNNVTDLRQLLHLKDLTHLSVLWLQKNPCALLPNYRKTTIRTLPQLSKLDNKVVTEEDRLKSIVEGDLLESESMGEPAFKTAISLDLDEKEVPEETECDPIVIVQEPESVKSQSTEAPVELESPLLSESPQLFQSDDTLADAPDERKEPGSPKNTEKEVVDAIDERTEPGVTTDSRNQEPGQGTQQVPATLEVSVVSQFCVSRTDCSTPREVVPQETNAVNSSPDNTQCSATGRQGELSGCSPVVCEEGDSGTVVESAEESGYDSRESNEQQPAAASTSRSVAYTIQFDQRGESTIRSESSSTGTCGNILDSSEWTNGLRAINILLNDLSKDELTTLARLVASRIASSGHSLSSTYTSNTLSSQLPP